MIKRNKWFEFYLPSDYTHWRIYYSVPSDDHETYSDGSRDRAWITIGFWKFFFMLYLWKVTPFESDFGKDSSKRYGFTLSDRTLHLHWGDTWVYWLPWSWMIIRHDLLYPDGTVFLTNDLTNKNQKHATWYKVLDESDPFIKYHVHEHCVKTITLTHKTKSGTIQSATIKLKGEEREWRWLWFKWLPFPRQIHRVVDCESDIELGEKAGSWKGGMMGWSCEWKKHETMEDAFWRWYDTWNGR